MLIYIQIYVCIVFQIFFYYGLLQNIYYYLCYAIGPCLYIFYIVVYIYVNPKLPVYHFLSFLFDNQKFGFCVCESVSVL